MQTKEQLRAFIKGLNPPLTGDVDDLTEPSVAGVVYTAMVSLQKQVAAIGSARMGVGVLKDGDFYCEDVPAMECGSYAQMVIQSLMGQRNLVDASFIVGWAEKNETLAACGAYPADITEKMLSITIILPCCPNKFERYSNRLFVASIHGKDCGNWAEATPTEEQLDAFTKTPLGKEIKQNGERLVHAIKAILGTAEQPVTKVTCPVCGEALDMLAADPTLPSKPVPGEAVGVCSTCLNFVMLDKNGQWRQMVDSDANAVPPGIIEGMKKARSIMAEMNARAEVGGK